MNIQWTFICYHRKKKLPVTHMALCGGRGCHEWFAEVRGPQNPSEIVSWGSDEDPYQQFLLE